MARAFRLGGLLRLRKLQEEQAEAEAARANAERRAADKRRYDTAVMLAGAALPDEGDELTWRAAIAARAALTGLTSESVTAVEAAQARVHEATAHWAEARARATALEKLEDRHSAALRTEEDHAEQLVLDEAALRGRTTTDPPIEGER
ncbi:flagellar export protein FliJ [Actinotalea sp. C106]|uniref:flagellar export protein FliJ n=1 Tax=Actinotalea sp. C106 TaxID=2908644 RepID=UPI002029082D|nr:flagellar export protein FliJ [Actinotalea sp. C106]